MRRREFIAALGGAAAWPLAARAQQSGYGASACSCPCAADDPEGQARLAAFRAGPAAIRLDRGRNIQIDYR